jgi:6-pyruvoyltetrahydropterin/6-carboxytetrahydropterin synthase
MFSLTVRDHFMIAHSFRGAVFGPAQALHGATYVVDMALRRRALDPDGLVADIGLASTLLRDELARLNYRNLDELPEFAGHNTTTEFLAQALHQRLSARILAGALGPHAVPDSDSGGIDLLAVTLKESHVASASYQAALA